MSNHTQRNLGPVGVAVGVGIGLVAAGLYAIYVRATSAKNSHEDAK